MIFHFATPDGVIYKAEWPCTVAEYEARSPSQQFMTRDCARCQVFQIVEMTDDNSSASEAG